MTTKDRAAGWLDHGFHAAFREVLIHTMFRHALACPIYCCMPDHIHLLWIGVLEESDQTIAVQYFRKHVNALLKPRGVKFQRQPYDHVLREEERDRGAFEALAEYIARNPERAGLIPPDGFRQYPYSGCCVPGYPDIRLWEGDYWNSFWRAYNYLAKVGVLRLAEAAG